LRFVAGAVVDRVRCSRGGGSCCVSCLAYVSKVWERKIVKEPTFCCSSLVFEVPSLGCVSEGGKSFLPSSIGLAGVFAVVFAGADIAVVIPPKPAAEAVVVSAGVLVPLGVPTGLAKSAP
jgi:histidinol dehydrogenase